MTGSIPFSVTRGGDIMSMTIAVGCFHDNLLFQNEEHFKKITHELPTDFL
jgi:hypothetical protein